MQTEKQADEFFISQIKESPIYVWGANYEKLTEARAIQLFKSYGSSTYTMDYYNNKIKEAGNGQKYCADCSGIMIKISGRDNTAQGYYNECSEKGMINTIDLSHSCLVFRGKSATSINHIGYYCASNGEVMEMESSKTNFQHRKFDATKWKWWGIPKWIDYSKPSIPISIGWTDILKPKVVAKNATTYPCKGIDLSSYNEINDYNKLNSADVKFAILKIMRKDLEKDTKFEKHYENLLKVGIPIFAVYNYSYALDTNKARLDAQQVIHHLNGRNIPVVLDLEDKSQQGLGSKIIDIINTYQSTIEAAGLQFLVYTGMSFYNSFIKPYITKINCKNWWIARYYNGYKEMQFGVEPNSNYKPSMANIGWQYTSSGKINGYSGNLDLNIIYSSSLNKQAIVDKKEKITFYSPMIKSDVNQLRIRSLPNTSGKVLGYLKGGDKVSIYDKDFTSGWYAINPEKTKWISDSYVVSITKGVVTANSLNIRTSDSTTGKVIGAYKSGDAIDIFGQSQQTKWYLTNLGWVSNKYVSI